jgi:hypothetical protein
MKSFNSAKRRRHGRAVGSCELNSGAIADAGCSGFAAAPEDRRDATTAVE